MTQCCMRMEEYQKRYTQLPTNVIQKYREERAYNKNAELYKYYIENEEGDENA